jgi:hypothetical protein
MVDEWCDAYDRGEPSEGYEVEGPVRSGCLKVSDVTLMSKGIQNR